MQETQTVFFIIKYGIKKENKQFMLSVFFFIPCVHKILSMLLLISKIPITTPREIKIKILPSFITLNDVHFHLQIDRFQHFII